MIDRLGEVGTTAIKGRWLDPACGEGIFLSELVELLASQVSTDALPSAVESHLFGVDIDPVACRRTRQSVREAVIRHSGPQPVDFFSANVRPADFLTIDPQIEGGYDFVLGNPPYVSAQTLTAAQKRSLQKRFDTAWGRLDLYSIFIEQALHMLAPGGLLSFITPDTWLTAASSKRLRRFIAEGYRVQAVERFERHDLFPGVATIPCVSVIQRSNERPGEAATAFCRHWQRSRVRIQPNPGPAGVWRSALMVRRGVSARSARSSARCDSAIWWSASRSVWRRASTHVSSCEPALFMASSLIYSDLPYEVVT